MQALLEIGNSASEAKWLSRIGSSFTGIVLGLIYVYFGWYKRDETGEDPRKHVKIKLLVFLLGSTGILKLLGGDWQDFYYIYISLFGFGTTVALILGMMTAAFISGLCAAKTGASQLSLALDCMFTCLFEGWGHVRRRIGQHADAIHAREEAVYRKSRLDLCRLAQAALDYLPHTPRAGGGSGLTFRHFFKSVAGYALCAFFQHSEDNEVPDYCVSFFVYDPSNNHLTYVEDFGGNVEYFVNKKTVLGPKSIAMQAVNRGNPLVWPDCMKLTGVTEPDPPITGGMNSFICVPVAQVADNSKCLGVLCVDSTQSETWRLRDPFHLRVLELVARFTGLFYENLPH